MGSFFYINGQSVPYPTRGANIKIISYVDSGRNANGEVVGQIVGRRNYKLDNLEWRGLTSDQVKYILQLLVRDPDISGKEKLDFQCTFPDPITDKFVTVNCYRGDINTTPYWVNVDGKPIMYESLKVNIIDTGLVEYENALRINNNV